MKIISTITVTSHRTFYGIVHSVIVTYYTKTQQFVQTLTFTKDYEDYEKKAVNSRFIYECHDLVHQLYYNPVILL